MNLAEKIYTLRKEAHWSQEELAAQLDVSRQSVSKWESNQAIPDSEKIIQMSHLFEVSTDYLLKDDLLDASSVEKTGVPTRRVTFQEAQTFVYLRQHLAKWFAIGTALLILSPVIMILLDSAQNHDYISLTSNVTTVIGLASLLILVAIGVGILVYSDMQLSDFEYLEKEPISLDPGIVAFVEQKKLADKKSNTLYTIIGVALLIMCPITVLIADMLTQIEFYHVLSVAILLAMVAVAVSLFILSGVTWNSYQMLLEEGDYTPQKKQNNSIIDNITGIYWVITVAIFVIIGLLTNKWGQIWLIFPIAGFLFAILSMLFSLKQKNN